ncbi:MAG: HAMP domain-containing histidine kinase [Bacteroidales bacterium]|nr:HAMP domain-containing histidine kinase [Bacteroidales bacterium]
MKNNRKIFILPAVLILLVIAGFLSESLYNGTYEYRLRTGRFNRMIKAREKVMYDCIEGIKEEYKTGGRADKSSIYRISRLAQRNNITLLAYVNDTLDYWSDNGLDVPETWDERTFAENPGYISNGWFLVRQVSEDSLRIAGLIRLMTDYGIENDILRNGFLKVYRLPAGTQFSVPEASPYKISDSQGNYLFSLVFPRVKSKTPFIILPLLVWLALLIFIIYTTLYIARILATRGRNIQAVLFCFFVFSVTYLVFLLSGKPSTVYQTGLFSPYRFTAGKMIPSEGHLIILGLLLSALFLVFRRYLPVKVPAKDRLFKSQIILFFLLLPASVMILLWHNLFSYLILNSSINFETYRILKLSFYSIAGFTAMGLLFLAPFFYLVRISEAYAYLSFKSVTPAIMLSSFPIFAGMLTGLPLMLPAVLLYLALCAGLFYAARGKSITFNIIVFFSVIMGLYSVALITILSENRITENIKTQSVAYSTEVDPQAEYLLLDMWPGLSSDSLLRKMMDVGFFETDDLERISNYLYGAYFNGYWENYTINIVLCNQYDPLRIGSGNEVYEDCFSFFEGRIEKLGHPVTGTGFYLIDNQKGRPNYLGTLYFETTKKITTALFIELYRDINVMHVGYSELLTDRRLKGYSWNEEYSMAKYINGEIVFRTGEFSFHRTDEGYVDPASDYHIIKTNGYKLVVYRNGNVSVVIGRPALSAIDIVISFAYLFAFIFLFSGFVHFIIRRPSFENLRNLNFRQKLQVSFIGVLLFSFIIVGILVAALITRQYQDRHYETVREKLNSVFIELDNNISAEKEIEYGWKNSSWSSMNELLIRISNIFNTDINLYSPEGNLISTSRPEIYYRNLSGRRMDNTALANLSGSILSEYYQKEKIGTLEYISAYMPIYNTENKLLAYLNLPYFRLQNQLAREISNVIVTVINFTLLLIVIAMSLAVIISNRLTLPLRMLSRGLASVELGKKSEHLEYSGTDEIGELVRQYNRMVDELDESARKLANSEREYAWREMARQVAHEIKNPLTPMKLNVQQLLKSWKDNVPGFEKKLERFCMNQIEYINNLSSIAGEFSSFAKMPGNNPTEVDLQEQLKINLELFKNSANISFRCSWPHGKKILIFADRDHLNSVFSNLIQNAIQAIPPGQEGLIKIGIELKDDKVIVSVADNGTGIPEELRMKMFTPNFTTKSSGTGLGLSIAKRYVEMANGRIWFESETGKGSIFYIEYPLLRAI